MIDWTLAEIYAISNGIQDLDLIQQAEPRNLLEDLEAGHMAWSSRASATTETWLTYGRGKRILGHDHCHINGTSRLISRKAKETMLEHNTEVRRRLLDPEDQCHDLVGDGIGSKLLNEDDLALKLVEKYKITDRFKTNWKQINAMLSNFYLGDVMLLSGLSGTGKTNVALQMSYFAGYKTLYYGVDMSVPAVAERLFKIKWYRDNNGLEHEFLRDECDLAVEKMAKNGNLRLDPGIRVYDCDSMTLEQIEHSARNEIKKFQATVLIIDYAGRIESSKTNVKEQWREDAEIARAIKGMAKRLNVRVIALSQFSGKAEQYKKPDRSWMSGSKELISSTDVILSIWQDSTIDANGKIKGDSSHIWISDDIKNRDSGTHGNARLETYGLWLSEDF